MPTVIRTTLTTLFITSLFLLNPSNAFFPLQSQEKSFQFSQLHKIRGTEERTIYHSLVQGVGEIVDTKEHYFNKDGTAGYYEVKNLNYY